MQDISEASEGQNVTFSISNLAVIKRFFRKIFSLKFVAGSGWND